MYIVIVYYDTSLALCMDVTSASTFTSAISISAAVAIHIPCYAMIPVSVK